MTVSALDLVAVLPEIILLVAASAILLARPGRSATGVLALMSLAGAFAATLPQWLGPALLFHGAYLVMPGIAYLKCLALVATAVATIALHHDREVQVHHPEIAALMLTMAAGACLLVSARHLAVAYLAFEMLSIPAYALVGSLAGNSKSTEAGLKYAVFGGAASACLLYALSLVYGATGTLKFAALPLIFSASPSGIIALVLLFAGLMYKLAATPFHYWCPDAFEGAPVSVAGFLSVVPKIAGFGLVFALYSVLAAEHYSRLLAIAALLSMTYGNLAAIAQANVKRLLAYSSIAHAGYLLLAASLVTTDGIAAILYYLTAYLFMNLGAFYVAGLVAPRGTVEEFRGLAGRAPMTALAMAVFLFSLTGLPPFGGFVGKLLIIAAGLKSAAYVLIAALVANTVVSLYYYARILREMYLEAGEVAPLALGALPRLTLGALVVALLVLGIYWGGIGRLVFMVA